MANYEIAENSRIILDEESKKRVYDKEYITFTYGALF
jgi:hypothetical protein